MLNLHPLLFLRNLSPLLALSVYISLVFASCCIPGQKELCANLKPVVGWCCGQGPCNIFCCNCDGGCLLPPIPTHTIPSLPHTTKTITSHAHNGYASEATDANVNENNNNNDMLAKYAICTASAGLSIFSGDEDCGSQLFQMLDVEGVGRISLGQYLVWYAGRFGGTDFDNLDDEIIVGAAEYFHRFDADGDGYVDEVEMKQAVG